MGRPFSEAETARLGEIMQELSGTSDLNPIGAQEGVRLINFAKGLSSADFTKMVKTAIERLELDDDVGVEIKLFQSQNGYIINDWGVNPNGEDYINGLRGGERSDLQRRVRDIVTQIQGGSMKSTSTSQNDTASPETKASTSNTDEKATLPTQKM